MNNLPDSDFYRDSGDELLNNNSNLLENVNLPIFNYKAEIIEAARDNQILVIHGETGSGKTTQIPQYLLQAGLNDGKLIGITQPRKIGAVNMARRVSEEMNCPVGKEVGYEIRFDNKSSASTKIKYMTDGILLNQCVNDRNLNDYGVIMIDEAHERILRSDVLLGMLKEIVSRRTDLKIIIASATIDTKKFSRYFSKAPIIYIEGNIYEVEVFYQDRFPHDYIREIVHKVREIDDKGEEGDVLIFLIGRDEIERCVEELESYENLAVLPLYSALEYDEQQRVFAKVANGVRKVIVATNIAETSITIDGIRFVIDCGYVKQTNYNPRYKMEVWEEVKISKAQANQRKGRAGRTAPGVCYRLYSEKDYERFLDQAKPEMARKNLSEIYLKVHAFGLNPLSFEFIDPPDQDALLHSRQELTELDFINESGTLTEDGQHMLDLPLEPMVGKVLLAAIRFKCVKKMAIILAMLLENNVFRSPRHYSNDAHDRHRTFYDDDGDPFTLYNVFQKWKENGKSETWCGDNFVDSKSMEEADLVQNQLESILKRRLGNVPIEECTDKSAVKRAIMTGFYNNLCKKTESLVYERLIDKHRMYIHRSSCLFRVNPQFILYFELKKQKNVNMYGTMQVERELFREFPREMRQIGFRL